MARLSAEDNIVISDRLQQRGVKPTCVYCGERVQLLSSYVSIDNVAVVDRTEISKSDNGVAAASTVCPHCGHLAFFSLAVLDLLPEPN